MDLQNSLSLVLPEAILSVGGLMLLLAAAWMGDKGSRAISVAAVFVLAAAAAFTAPVLCGGAMGAGTEAFFGQVRADAFAAFMARMPESVLVVVDEAYAEFADAPDWGPALALQPRYPNLVVTRTFSKAHALAGLRIGYAVAHPGCIAVLERVRESFNANMAGLAAAEAALGDEAHLRRSLARNAEQRGMLAGALRERGHFVHPSMTNFLLAEFGADAPRIEAGLLERGVVLRPMAGYGLPGCLRITVGGASENRRLLAALHEVLA